MAEKRKEAAESPGDDAAYAARAAFYGLDLKDAPKDALVVADGECIRLTPRPNGADATTRG